MAQQCQTPRGGTCASIQGGLSYAISTPVTATTDFLAPDILNKCGRAVPALTHALGRTRCAKAFNRHSPKLFDHLIGADEQRRRHSEAKRFAVLMLMARRGAARAWPQEGRAARGELRDTGQAAPSRERPAGSRRQRAPIYGHAAVNNFTERSISLQPGGYQ
jgi:hypothetical protein